MTNELLKEKLLELKDETEKLLSSNHQAGKDQMYEILSQLQMIVRRVYPEYKEVEGKLLGDGVLYWDTDEVENIKILQEWFIRDVKRFVRAIDTILVEDGIFGIKDFTPLKEKTETTIGLGRNTWGFLRKKTKEK